jgi:hypothetical protein
MATDYCRGAVFPILPMDSVNPQHTLFLFDQEFYVTVHLPQEYSWCPIAKQRMTTFATVYNQQ